MRAGGTSSPAATRAACASGSRPPAAGAGGGLAPERRGRSTAPSARRVERPELLAPHLERRRDPLVRRERGRREERHALLAENARGVARRRRRRRARGRTRRAHLSPSGRADGLEEVRQEAGGRPRRATRFPSTSRGPPPRSARPDAVTAGAAASVWKQRISSAASRAGIMPLQASRLDYCDARPALRSDAGGSPVISRP